VRYGHYSDHSAPKGLRMKHTRGHVHTLRIVSWNVTDTIFKVAATMKMETECSAKRICAPI
jgi:hypothetical protein